MQYNFDTLELNRLGADDIFTLSTGDCLTKKKIKQWQKHASLTTVHA